MVVAFTKSFKHRAHAALSRRDLTEEDPWRVYGTFFGLRRSELFFTFFMGTGRMAMRAFPRLATGHGLPMGDARGVAAAWLPTGLAGGLGGFLTLEPRTTGFESTEWWQWKTAG